VQVFTAGRFSGGNPTYRVLKFGREVEYLHSPFSVAAILVRTMKLKAHYIYKRELIKSSGAQRDDKKGIGGCYCSGGVIVKSSQVCCFEICSRLSI
jgi:hypothetical protein